MVYPGTLARIVVLQDDVALKSVDELGPYELSIPPLAGGSVTRLDARGVDAYDNFMFVLPTFEATNGVGAFGTASTYGQFTAAYVFPERNGLIRATLGGYRIEYRVQVLGHLVLCNFDTGRFDSDCMFN